VSHISRISGEWKYFISSDYNYRFNMRTGLFIRWGKTLQDDPYRSEYGPEIADIEITTICSGSNGSSCPYCYKENNSKGINMALDTFKTVVNRINANNQLTQVAFGLGSTGEENPSLWEMCTWLLKQNIIPNGTIADISNETADKIASYFGSCAVSLHSITGSHDICYNSVKRLTDRGMSQVNIHYVLCEETYEECFKVLNSIQSDPRLHKLNALVFLSLKTKGRAIDSKFRCLSPERFSYLIKKALEMKINIGFDSCSFPKFKQTVSSMPNEKQLLMMAEGCESFGRFSIYVNVEGKAYPCSFCENTSYCVAGEDILSSSLMDIWNGKQNADGRKQLDEKDGNCPIFDI